jgi:hypothetical protein
MFAHNHASLRSTRLRHIKRHGPGLKAPTVLSVKEVLAHAAELKDRNPPQEIIVRFDVGSIMTVPTTYPDGSKHQVLHLVPNEGDAKFTAEITPPFLKQLKRIGIDDIPKHFVGKTVTLQGYVSGTGMALVGSPTIWTYHMTLHSYENVQAVTPSE